MAWTEHGAAGRPAAPSPRRQSRSSPPAASLMSLRPGLHSCDHGCRIRLSVRPLPPRSWGTQVKSRRPGLTGDARLLVAGQGVRAAGYGFTAVLLGALLAAHGFSSVQAGVVLTALIAGMALASLAVGRFGDRVGRRRSYALFFCGIAVAGTAVAAGGAVVGAAAGRAHRHAVHGCGRQRTGDHAGAGHARRRGCGHGGGLRAVQRGRLGRRRPRLARGHPPRPQSTGAIGGRVRVAVPGHGPGRDHRHRPCRGPVPRCGGPGRRGVTAGAGGPGAVAAWPVPGRGAAAGRPVRGGRRGRRPGHHRVPVLLLHRAVPRLGGLARLAVLRCLVGAGGLGGGGAAAGPAVWPVRHHGRHPPAQQPAAGLGSLRARVRRRGRAAAGADHAVADGRAGPPGAGHDRGHRAGANRGRRGHQRRPLLRAAHRPAGRRAGAAGRPRRAARGRWCGQSRVRRDPVALGTPPGPGLWYRHPPAGHRGRCRSCRLIRGAVMIVCLRTVVVPPEWRDRYLAWIAAGRAIRQQHGILAELVCEPAEPGGETVVITMWPSHEVFDAWIATPYRDALTSSAVHRAVSYRPITRYEVTGGYLSLPGLTTHGPSPRPAPEELS